MTSPTSLARARGWFRRIARQRDDEKGTMVLEMSKQEACRRAMGTR
jgi:hypothetical protein